MTAPTPPEAPHFITADVLKFWARRIVSQFADSDVPAFYEMSEEHLQILAVEAAAIVAMTLMEGTHGQA